MHRNEQRINNAHKHGRRNGRKASQNHETAPTSRKHKKSSSHLPFESPPPPQRQITFQQHKHSRDVDSVTFTDEEASSTESSRSFQSQFNGAEELYFVFRGKMSELISSYSYYIKERGGSWKALSTWDGSEPPATKQKSQLIFSIDESSTVVKVMCKEVPEWRANIKVRTNISQSSKKFLQFTDSSIKKQPVVYGFGFDSEHDAKHCMEVITKMKNKLDDLRMASKSNKAAEKAQMLASQESTNITRKELKQQSSPPKPEEKPAKASKPKRQLHSPPPPQPEVAAPESRYHQNHQPPVAVPQLNKTAPPVIPYEPAIRTDTFNSTVNSSMGQQELTAHPASFNTSTISNTSNQPLQQPQLPPPAAMMQQQSPLAEKAVPHQQHKDNINLHNLSQIHQDQENSHLAQRWQRENEELRAELAMNKSREQELQKKLSEQMERTHVLEQDKSSIHKLMNDQAVNIRDLENKNKLLKQMEDEYKALIERTRQMELRNVVLQKVQDERVPELELKIREKEMQSEKYLKILQDIQEQLHIALPNGLRRRFDMQESVTGSIDSGMNLNSNSNSGRSEIISPQESIPEHVATTPSPVPTSSSNLSPMSSRERFERQNSDTLAKNAAIMAYRRHSAITTDGFEHTKFNKFRSMSLQSEDPVILPGYGSAVSLPAPSPPANENIASPNVLSATKYNFYSIQQGQRANTASPTPYASGIN
jgi:hypothetical protein